MNTIDKEAVGTAMCGQFVLAWECATEAINSGLRALLLLLVWLLLKAADGLGLLEERLALKRLKRGKASERCPSSV